MNRLNFTPKLLGWCKSMHFNPVQKPNRHLHYLFHLRNPLIFSLSLVLLVVTGLQAMAGPSDARDVTASVHDISSNNIFHKNSQPAPYRPGPNLRIIVLQPIEVYGKVTDSLGNPLIGVTIRAKEEGTGTTSDANGNYTITVPEDAVLEVSYVGYRTQEVVVNGRENIDIVLKAAVSELGQLVIVGYGTQKKENLTGSVSSIEFDKEMDNRPITNASQALSGKASGVWVNQQSGKPGSDAAQIRIRGWGTMNNANPLVIIDGVEGSFDQINPENIESISILKDAASAAIYGSKAANGVILIQTKTGKKNQDISVKLNAYVGIQMLGRRYHFVDNSVEYMKLYNRALANIGSSPLYPDYLISAFEKGNDKYKFPNTDWNKAFFRDVPIQNYNLSFEGGGEKTSSYISFNYRNQEGIIPNTKSEKYGVRANISSDVSNWLKVSGRFHYSRKVSKEPFNFGQVYTMLSTTVPTLAPYTRDGKFGSIQAIDSSGEILYDNRNPLIEAYNGNTRNEQNVLLANGSFKADIAKGLFLKATIATAINWTETDKHNITLFGFTDSGMKSQPLNYNREGLIVSRADVFSMQNNIYATANYHKIFSHVHDLSVVGGIQLESSTIKSLSASRTDPSKEGLTQVAAGTSDIQGTGNMKGVRMFSYFGRLNYNFREKYLFEMDLRADASSRFRPSKRWGVFPGFSVGWRLGEENFIKRLHAFSSLKIRASWGRLGNQNVNGYWPYLATIDENFNVSYNLNDGLKTGAAVTELVDQNITWETTTSTDVGLDFGFFKNRIIGSFEYYNKLTSDIIVQLPIPGLMGNLTPPFQNLGEMKNKGFNLSLGYKNQNSDKNKLGLDLSFNISYNKNTVTKFQGGNSPDQLFLIREGYPFKSIYGYKVTGIFQSDEEAKDYMNSNNVTPKAGDLKYEDLNGDGKLDYRDKQVIGNTIPKLTYGLTAGLSYKGFDLRVLFQGAEGVNSMIDNDYTQVRSNVASIIQMWEDSWTPQNKNTRIPRLALDYSWNEKASSFWAVNTSFLKIRNVQLGYEIPLHERSLMGIDNLYLYINAQNVYTFVSNDYHGYDPERNNMTNSSTDSQYPKPRVFTFGVNVSF